MGMNMKSQNKGNILLVEADPEVRGEVTRILSREGYRVFEAADGHQALLLTEAIAHPIHLLLTDAALDGSPTGVDLAGHLLVLNRLLKVLYLSSYPTDLLIRHQLQKAFAAYISKPLEADILVAKVGTMMGKIRTESAMDAAEWKRESDLQRRARLIRMFPQGFTGRIFPHGKDGQIGCRPVNESVV